MRLYFDYAASTPVDQRVTGAMSPYFRRKFGNPGSLHSFGQEALAAVDRARETIARAVGADFREMIFTGSATEANNLAIKGLFRGAKKIGAIRGKPRVIVSSIEHESVLEAAHALKEEGAEIAYLPVSRAGIIDLSELSSLLDDQTVLVSVIAVSNEVGALEPIARIGETIRRWRGSGVFPLFHSDAAQALQFLDCDVRALGVDMLTLSAHKIYGPKGIGALYVKNIEFRGQDLGGLKKRRERLPLNPKSYFLTPLVVGGGQEFGLRSGTENVPLIVGFGKALELVLESRERESRRTQDLKTRFFEGLRSIIPEIAINGPELRDGIPHILNVHIPHQKSEDLLLKLDLSGIAVSAGSACTARAAVPSYILQAMGYSRERAASSLRISFGRQTTKREIDKALKVIKMVMKK